MITLSPMRILDAALPRARQEQVMVHETPTVTDRVKRIISDVLADTGIAIMPENMPDGDTLDSMGADGLDVIDIVNRVEMQLGIEVPDVVMDTSLTVREVVTLVTGRLEAR